MKNLKKRALSVVLMLAIIVTLVPFTSIEVNAAYGGGSETILVCPEYEHDDLYIVTAVNGDTITVDNYYYGEYYDGDSGNYSKSSFDATTISVGDVFYYDYYTTLMCPCNDSILATAPTTAECSLHGYHYYMARISGSNVAVVAYDNGYIDGAFAESVSATVDYLGSCEEGVWYYDDSNCGRCTELSPIAAPQHNHTSEWKISIQPTFLYNGLAVYACTECGFVSEMQSISREATVYLTYINDLEAQLENATPGTVLKINLGDWHSVPKYMMEKITTCGYDVELLYRYQGKAYDIIIPANKPVVGDFAWYGPLLMYSYYGK